MSGPDVELPIPDDAIMQAMVALYGYWQSLPGSKPRDQVDMLAIDPELPPHINLCKVLNQGRVLRYDSVGPCLKKVAPRLVSGDLSTDPMEIEETDYDLIHEMLCETTCRQVPRVVFLEFLSLEGVPWQAFELLLPLGIDQVKGHCEDLLIAVWSMRPKTGWIEERCIDVTVKFKEHLPGM